MAVERILQGSPELGEGPSWEAETGCLWWVDILGRRLFRGNPGDGTTRYWDFDTEVCAALSMGGDERAVVLRDRIVAFHPDTGRSEELWRGKEPPNNRFNDACVAPDGALWIASMDFDAEAPTGALWRITRDGSATRADHGYSCANGPAFSPDGCTLYVGDTMNGQVIAFDHQPGTGSLSNRRIHIDLGRFGGLSDGMAVDSAGTLWIAQITAGRIGGYAPDGTHMATIPVPVPMPTSVAFGGEDLRSLYITTARIIADDTDLAAWPDSGSVFVTRMDTPGLAEPSWSAS